MALPTINNRSGGFKEFARKKLVYIKRNPQIFPKILMVIACCFFTFNLSPYSFAAVDVDNTLPAVGIFVITLLSFMMIISFIGVGSSLSKKRISVIIAMTFVAIQIVLQILFIVIFTGELAALTAEELAGHRSWQTSISLSYVHLALLLIVALSVVFMPLYGKALAKINTARPDMLSESGMDIEELEPAD